MDFWDDMDLGEKLLKEGENLEEAAEHLRVAVELDPFTSPCILP